MSGGEICEFLNQRGISSEIDLNPPLAAAIEVLQLAHRRVDDGVTANLERLSSDVAWAVMHDMHLRCREYCCGAVSCFVVTHIGAAEALCRTAIEASVNLHYVSLGDSLANELAYLKDHLRTERRQNQQWRKSVADSAYPTEAKEHHYACILKKDAALEGYEQMLRASLAAAGFDFDAYDDRWPSVFDRFCRIGQEVAYRTVYAALCSQAHNDAEEILNSIGSRVVKIEGMAQANFAERYRFALYMLLTAIQYHLRATALYLAKYSLKEAQELTTFHELLGEHIREIVMTTPDAISAELAEANGMAVRGDREERSKA